MSFTTDNSVVNDFINLERVRAWAIVSSDNPLGCNSISEDEFVDRYIKWSGRDQKDKERLNKETVLERLIYSGYRSRQFSGAPRIALPQKTGEQYYILFNITAEDAKNIAMNHGQERFFFAENNSDGVIITYYTMRQKFGSYPCEAVSDNLLTIQEVEEFYLQHGMNVKVNIKAAATIIPNIKDDYAFERSLDPELTPKGRAIERRYAYDKPERAGFKYEDWNKMI